ncbi:hypothetical protein AA100600_1545 [Gluconobacter thailandicus F149-1 = NBRC 100600]|nr:hypothetical protein AA100600_1545 [Gluconobacter thailandicus F149-1 = NBRC 100600]
MILTVQSAVSPSSPGVSASVDTRITEAEKSVAKQQPVTKKKCAVARSPVKNAPARDMKTDASADGVDEAFSAAVAHGVAVAALAEDSAMKPLAVVAS